MIKYWIDIPNLKTVDLRYSFEFVQSKSITSIYMNNIEWIDVSPILAELVPVTYSYDYIESLESNVASIHLPDRTCNDLEYTIFDFSRFNLLEELIIGSNSFMNVNKFVINELNHLKSIEIGDSCFSNVNLFNIDGLNELKSLKIGEYSFRYSSFEIRGIIVVILLMNRSY